MKIPMKQLSFYTIKFAALLTGCIFLYSSCENKLADVQRFSQKSIGKDVAKDVAIRYSLSGRKKAVLTGSLMYRVQDTIPYVEFPQSIHVDFFNEGGDTIQSKLTARYAKYIESQSKVYLKDSVRVINILGDTLYCDELFWDRSKTGQEFYTDKPVKIRRRMEIIDGIGLTARQDFKEWLIVKPVGFIKVGNSQFPN
jgi:LPS export ABC transporter protein LptC